MSTDLRLPDDVPTVQHDTGVAPPEKLGRLHRVSRLGAGRCASVWLYRDDELESLVAVKLLADDWARDLGVRERFLTAGRMLRQVDSDHVVRVYDVGVTEDESPYVVMTYADRGSVADLLGRPLDLARTVELVAQAGDGLDVLHRHGIVHGDVTPGNLLLRTERDGEGTRLLVGDPGLAKELIPASGTRTGAYMAPEQSDPAVVVDERADVHALGAVTYHMLTGRPLREGGTSSPATAAVPPASSRLAAVPQAVDDVVLIACNPDREERWPDIETFVAELRRAARPQPVAAPFAPPAPAAVRDDAAAPETERSGTWLLATALLAFVVMFALGWWLAAG